MWEGIRKIFGVDEKLEITDEYRQISTDFEAGCNLYVSGKAGTGKSKLIEHIRNTTNKKVAVLAPTGLAALNIKGQTIHSFFCFPWGVMIPGIANRIRADEAVFKQLGAVIIDEVSMVRADVMEAMDTVMRRFGPDSRLAFGGVQIMLVGDVFQLPPVVTREELEVFSSRYQLPYFFASQAYDKGEFKKVQLTRVFRQTDEEFVRILNLIRSGEMAREHLEIINSRANKTPDLKKEVVLAATNKIVNEINMQQLAQLSGSEKVYRAVFSGDFPREERSLPVEPELRLKKGARVLILKNGTGYANGSTGAVVSMGEDAVKVKLDEDGKSVEVGYEEWDNVTYKVDKKTGRFEEKKSGTMRQIPLRLAWAVTIHKSQGMSFDRVFVDFSRSPFAHGQAYVALSRCRSLEGLSLSRQVYPNDIIVDPAVVEFGLRKG